MVLRVGERGTSLSQSCSARQQRPAVAQVIVTVGSRSCPVSCRQLCGTPATQTLLYWPYWVLAIVFCCWMSVVTISNCASVSLVATDGAAASL